jgi:spore maturation protein B
MEWLSKAMQAASDWAIPLIFISIALVAAIKKVRVYEVFVEGAKEGFNVGVRIIPYLVAILGAIAIFRGSGAMDYGAKLLAPVLAPLGIPSEVLPMAIIRPLSGSGGLGVLSEGLKNFGADSFLGNMMSTMAGSTETTFYVIAVYFGSISIRYTRHTILACIIGDLASLLGAIYVSNLFFN